MDIGMLLDGIVADSVDETKDISPQLQFLAKNFGAPVVCPSCGNKLVLEGVDIVCVNDDCGEKKLNAMNVFLKKLKIKNVDVATLRNFNIYDFKDLLVPVAKNESRKILVKLSEELSAKLFTLPAKNLFCAMNFKGLSEILLNKIIDWCSWTFIESNIKAGNLEKAVRDYAAINGLPMGIGEITLEKFIASAEKNFKNVELITSDSRYCGNVVSVQVRPKTGISICFTGALETMGRTKAAEKAAEAGFEVKSGVSKGLTYLVTNDTESGSSKNKKAKALGTKIINEKEFLKLLGMYNSNLENLDEI